MLQVIHADFNVQNVPFIAVLAVQEAVTNQVTYENVVNLVSTQLFPQYAPDEIVLVYQNVFGQYRFRGRQDIVRYLKNLSDDDWNMLRWVRTTFQNV